MPISHTGSLPPSMWDRGSSWCERSDCSFSHFLNRTQGNRMASPLCAFLCAWSASASRWTSCYIGHTGAAKILAWKELFVKTKRKKNHLFRLYHLNWSQLHSPKVRLLAEVKSAAQAMFLSTSATTPPFPPSVKRLEVKLMKNAFFAFHLPGDRARCLCAWLRSRTLVRSRWTYLAEGGHTCVRFWFTNENFDLNNDCISWWMKLYLIWCSIGVPSLTSLAQM